MPLINRMIYLKTDEETEDPVDESKDENSEAAYPIVGLTPGKKETEKKSVEEPSNDQLYTFHCLHQILRIHPPD